MKWGRVERCRVKKGWGGKAEEVSIRGSINKTRLRGIGRDDVG